jgi:hypothetical protein
LGSQAASYRRCFAAAATFAAVSGLAAPSSPLAQQVINAGPQVNPLTLAVRQAGVNQCLGQFDAIGRFLNVDENSGLAIWVNQLAPDQQLVSVSIELREKGKAASTYVTATAAPNTMNGCSFSYEASTYHPIKCDKVAESSFKGAKMMGTFKKEIQTLALDNGGRVFLMPAGTGCLAIKKEVMTR